MKNRIEFHSLYTEEPFMIDPHQIVKVDRWMDGAMIHMNWIHTQETALEVCENYETVQRKLDAFYYPNENVSGWPYE